VPTDDFFMPDDQLRPGIALSAAQERGQDEPIARPEARVADLPLQDPKLMPKDREFSLAIVCRTTPTGSDQAVDQGLEGRRRGERRARAPEMLAVWSTGPLRAKEAFWGPGAVSKPHAARAEDYPREPGHLLGLTID
jgi:hypothetical protein